MGSGAAGGGISASGGDDEDEGAAGSGFPIDAGATVVHITEEERKDSVRYNALVVRSGEKRVLQEHIEMLEAWLEQLN
jgi:hypothetical protein